MILHVSKAFAERLKCAVSLSDQRPAQKAVLDSWSADILKLRRGGSLAVIMNDASLTTLIFPLKGIRKFEGFIASFLKRAAVRFADQGGQLDSENQTVIVLSRSDRSLIGTMNEAKFMIDNCVSDAPENGSDVDWDRIEQYMNEVIYSRIDYDQPQERLRKLLR